MTTTGGRLLGELAAIVEQMKASGGKWVPISKMLRIEMGTITRELDKADDMELTAMLRMFAERVYTVAGDPLPQGHHRAITPDDVSRETFDDDGAALQDALNAIDEEADSGSDDGAAAVDRPGAGGEVPTPGRHEEREEHARGVPDSGVSAEVPEGTSPGGGQQA